MKHVSAPAVGFLLRWAHWIVVSALMAMLVLSFVIYRRASDQMLEFAAVTSARSTSDFVEAFRTLYTREVVRKVGRLGIEATHDYADRDDSIPLPVTFSNELGDSLGAESGLRTGFFSPYPFPWRRSRGELDGFQLAAWASLNGEPGEPFYRVEQVDGTLSIRYATSVVMEAACIGCHNSHPSSPKVDWKTGDVRGVLEVVQPIESVARHARAQIRFPFLLFLAAGTTSLIAGAGGLLAYRARQAQLAAMHGEAERQNQTLAIVNEELRQFSYRASHDLKAPLLSMQGLADCVEEDLDDGEIDEARESVAMIREQAKRLAQTVEHVLQLARLEHLEIRDEPIDLPRMIHEIESSLDSIIRARSVEIRCSLLHGEPPRSNPTRVRQILENLIANGIKYSDPEESHPYVWIKSFARGRALVLKVEDNGIGISEEDRARVFKIFERLQTGGPAGSGLGLYLVERHVAALGGTIELEHLEKGTRFSISLPNGLDSEP